MKEEFAVKKDEILKLYWCTFLFTSYFNLVYLMGAQSSGINISSLTFKFIVFYHVAMAGIGIWLYSASKLPERILMTPIGIMFSIASFVALLAHNVILVNKYGFSPNITILFSALLTVIIGIWIGRWYSNNKVKEASEFKQKKEAIPSYVYWVTFTIVGLARVVMGMLSDVYGNLMGIFNAYMALTMACAFTIGFGILYTFFCDKRIRPDKG